jgi:hypothetical protein
MKTKSTGGEEKKSSLHSFVQKRTELYAYTDKKNLKL